MALNGISTLPTKQQRQLAKLALAADNRNRQGYSRKTLDLSQLPTQYLDNDVVDNPNADGLKTGRPWI